MSAEEPFSLFFHSDTVHSVIRRTPLNQNVVVLVFLSSSASFPPVSFSSYNDGDTYFRGDRQTKSSPCLIAKTSSRRQHPQAALPAAAAKPRFCIYDCPHSSRSPSLNPQARRGLRWLVPPLLLLPCGLELMSHPYTQHLRSLICILLLLSVGRTTATICT
jgi:hypothetical protein